MKQPTLLTATLFAVVLSIGCGGGLQGNGNGGGGNIDPGTTPGTYIITVTAAAGTVTHSSTVTLTVQ